MGLRANKKKMYEGPRYDERTGKDLLVVKQKRAEKNSGGKVSNAVFATSDGSFINACTSLGIPATARQAGKYREKRGIVHMYLHGGEEGAMKAKLNLKGVIQPKQGK